MVAESVIVFKSDVGSERLFVEVFFVVFEQKIGGKNRSTKLCCGQSLLCGKQGSRNDYLVENAPFGLVFVCPYIRIFAQSFGKIVEFFVGDVARFGHQCLQHLSDAFVVGVVVKVAHDDDFGIGRNANDAVGFCF